MKQIMKALLAFLAIVLFSTGFPIQGAYANPSFTNEHYEAMNYLNQIRGKVGVGQVVLNPYLNQSAQSHAEYLSKHRVVQHEQQRGLDGFTGEGPKERILFAGYQGQAASFGEVVEQLWGQDVKSGIDQFMSGPFHRLGLLDHRLIEIGIGRAGDYLVINTGLANLQQTVPYHYPYDDQVVPDNMFGSGMERPDPFEVFSIPWKLTGYVVTYTFVEQGDYDFEITDQEGRKVPYFSGSAGLTKYLFPEDIASQNRTYTVTVKKQGQWFDQFNYTTTNPNAPVRVPQQPANPELPLETPGIEPKVPYKPPADLESALSRLNEVRAKMNLAPMKLDERLSEVARDYAKYLYTDKPASIHDGPTPYELARQAGKSNAIYFASLNGITDLDKVIDIVVMDTSYRQGFITDSNTEMGIGRYEDVIVLISDEVEPNAEPVHYPYDGQVGVELINPYYVDYVNNRLKSALPSYGGFPVTYRIKTAGRYQFALADSKSKSVEVDVYDFGVSQSVRDYRIIPRESLKPNETYTLTVHRNGALYDRFSFKTGAGSFLPAAQSEGTTSPEALPDRQPIDIGTRFPDYDPKAYWAESVSWAIENGYLRGIDMKDGNKPPKAYIIPSGALTEAELLTLLYRYDGGQEAQGEKPSWWAEDGYHFAAERRLPVRGGPDNRKAANEPITRAQMARILVSYWTEAPKTERQAVQYMYDRQWATGYRDKSGAVPKTYESFGPSQWLTRAELATLLHRISGSGQ